MRGPEWPHVYAHVDMDAFYVSVELKRRPELRGRPVVVAGSGPRAVVTTASYEARKFGVFSATPAERARRLCPDAIFLTPDFDHYRAVSKAVMAELRRHVELVEVVGLDEAYLDLTGFERPKAAARRVKAAVVEATGLNCSIGIGPSKLVAKVASDAEKPDGFVVMTAAEARARYADAAPGLVPGIGPKTAEKLRERGIETLSALAATPDDTLRQWFGGNIGPHLGRLARFEDDRPVSEERITKSESRETTFDRDLHAPDRMEEELSRLAAQLCAALTRQDQRGRTIGIKVRYDDFSTRTRARTLERPVNDEQTVSGIALELLRRLEPRRPVRLLGVRVAGLDEDERRRATGPAAVVSEDQLELSL
jgi:DNA polymerase IV